MSAKRAGLPWGLWLWVAVAGCSFAEIDIRLATDVVAEPRDDEPGGDVATIDRLEKTRDLGAEAAPDAQVDMDVADVTAEPGEDARDEREALGDLPETFDGSVDAQADRVAEMPADGPQDAAVEAAADAAVEAAADAAVEAAADAPPDVPPVCTPAGMTCPCAAMNPGGYCRPGEACTGGRCVAGALAGTLVISEIMNDPNATTDEVGEWVEVHNPGATPLDLRGLRISNSRAQATTLPTSAPAAVIAPGGYAVLARNMVVGVTPLWVYGTGLATNTLTYSNSASGDAVILDLGSSAMEIDRVTYSEAAMWPATTGRAKSLRPTALNAVANDMASNWCNASAQWMPPGSDYGSPGAANPACP